MTAKEYLNQALHLDNRINAKLEQIRSLRELAQNATSTLSDMPKDAQRNIRRMESTICKMLDLENEINADVDRLVELKREIMDVIGRVENPTYRMLLELRYLCFKPWDDVAAMMNYDRRYVHKVHGRALNEVDTKRHQQAHKDGRKSI
jgi:hypothetical protein